MIRSRAAASRTPCGRRLRRPGLAPVPDTPARSQNPAPTRGTGSRPGTPNPKESTGCISRTGPLASSTRYELLKHQDAKGGLDWAAVTRLLDPQPQHHPGQATERPTDPSRLARWVARLPEGNRNDGLFWAANRALEAGATDLRELAEAARSTGLEEREIACTLQSAHRRADHPFAADPPASRTPEPAGRQPEPQAPSRDALGPAAPRGADREPEAEAS
jgi:hypothetical protein